MADNMISKILKYIGIGTIIIGIIASFIVGSSAEEATITIGGIIGSVISGMLFVGFSEVINLLQQNVDNQEKIIRQFKEKPSTVVRNTTAISDEQSANRSTTVKHLFRCENCGRMIEEYPCCECGFKFN